MAKLSYLTVPDFLWLNLELTKENQIYSYAKLEEAVFCQYSYGTSHDLPRQAARLVHGFHRLRPFVVGNDGCGFVGLLVFLKMNHLELSLEPHEALEWFKHVSSDEVAGYDEIVIRGRESHDHHETGVKSAALEVIARYGEVLESLLEHEERVPLAMIANSRLTGEHR